MMTPQVEADPMPRDAALAVHAPDHRPIRAVVSVDAVSSGSCPGSPPEVEDDPIGDDEADLEEAAAESRPKRGRPKVTSEFWEIASQRMGMVGRVSRRTIVNHFYRQRAFGVLHDAEESGTGSGFGYLIEGNLRSDILTELGRLDDPVHIREAAALICRREMKTKDAVPLIRAWRNGRSAPGDAHALAGEIARLVRNYIVRHPRMTPDQVHHALEEVGLEYPRSGLDNGESMDFHESADEAV
jgi:hypothetical protein